MKLVLLETGYFNVNQSQQIRTVALMVLRIRANPRCSTGSLIFGRRSATIRASPWNSAPVRWCHKARNHAHPTLPGVYSLNPHSDDERVVVSVLTGGMKVSSAQSYFLVRDQPTSGGTSPLQVL